MFEIGSQIKVQVEVETKIERIGISYKDKKIFLIARTDGKGTTFEIEKQQGQFSNGAFGNVHKFVFQKSNPEVIEDMGKLIAAAGIIAKEYHMGGWRK